MLLVLKNILEYPVPGLGLWEPTSQLIWWLDKYVKSWLLLDISNWYMSTLAIHVRLVMVPFCDGWFCSVVLFLLGNVWISIPLMHMTSLAWMLLALWFLSQKRFVFFGVLFYRFHTWRGHNKWTKNKSSFKFFYL